jgi:hypothetical protein
MTSRDGSRDANLSTAVGCNRGSNPRADAIKVTVEQRDVLMAAAKRLKIPSTEMIRQAFDAYPASTRRTTKPAQKKTPKGGGKPR